MVVIIFISRFHRAHRPNMEDMRGIEGLFDKLNKEAEEAVARHEKYKELGTTSDYNTEKKNGQDNLTNTKGCV